MVMPAMIGGSGNWSVLILIGYVYFLLFALNEIIFTNPPKKKLNRVHVLLTHIRKLLNPVV